MIFRLVLASLSGAIIGWNRFRAGKPAGIGTHALVALGAAMFVVIPTHLSAPHEMDAFTRIVAGIATGVGFLGAGEILRDPQQGNKVFGLTSAAAIWVTAGLGVIAGCSSWLTIMAVDVLVLAIISLSPWIERKFPVKERQNRHPRP